MTLATIIATNYTCFELLPAESEEADMVINEEIVRSSCGVGEMLTKAAEGLKGDFRFEDRAGLCGFSAFTGGCGGSGVSTCARLYASVRAAFERKRVLLLSLDPYVEQTSGREGKQAGDGEGQAAGGRQDSIKGWQSGSESAPGSGAERIIAKILEGKNFSFFPACSPDSCGLYAPRYDSPRNPLFAMEAEDLEKLFICLEDSGDWDEVVIDLPRANSGWLDIMNMCEKRVVIFPADERTAFARLALEELECGSVRCAGDRNYIFEPARHEGGQAAVDIYGPAGCEVRKLAEAMARG